MRRRLLRRVDHNRAAHKSTRMLGTSILSSVNASGKRPSRSFSASGRAIIYGVVVSVEDLLQWNGKCSPNLRT